MNEWSNRRYPNGCRSCGQRERKHHGLGLCQRCWKNPDIKTAALDGTLVEYEFTNLDSQETIANSRNNPDSGNQGTDGSQVSDVENTPPPSQVSGERRPGTFSSAANDPDDVSPQASIKKSWREKLLGVKYKAKEAINPDRVFAPKTSEKAPRGVGRRVSTAETMEDVWSGIGGLALRFGHAPLGRYLQWQSSAAGEMLDQAVAGTFVDKRLLQPAVKARGRLDLLVALFGPPALILQIERNPAQAQMLIPILKSSIRSSLPTMLPAMKKAKIREDKTNEAIQEMFPDLPAGVDPVDLVIEQLFYGFDMTPPAPPAEPDNVESYADATAA